LEIVLSSYKSIAIDGPAASGKSSVGLKLSQDLGFLFLDTGIMYRAVTLAALQRGVKIDDVKDISDLASEIKIEIKKPSKLDGRTNDILVDGEDVTWLITENHVNDMVSIVSTYAGVRQAMTEQQRGIAMRGNIVMAGRDIGTVVLPDADYKFFLKASIEERARRRLKEEISHGKKSRIEEIIDNLRMRDEIDSSRVIAPLLPAADAIIIETDNKSVDEVVEEIKSYIKL